MKIDTNILHTIVANSIFLYIEKNNAKINFLLNKISWQLKNKIKLS